MGASSTGSKCELETDRASPAETGAETVEGKVAQGESVCSEKRRSPPAKAWGRKPALEG